MVPTPRCGMSHQAIEASIQKLSKVIAKRSTVLPSSHDESQTPRGLLFRIIQGRC